MRRLKSFIGVFLIMLSIGGLLLWEIKGRDVFLMEEIIVAVDDIHQGDKVNNSMFLTISVPKENKLEDALTANDINNIQGKIASQLILKNSQISSKYFIQDNFYLNEHEAIFVIKPTWISMRSSSLRSGDIVDIYGADGRGLIGTFQVAFVKDNAEREVRDIGADGASATKNNLLERADSTYPIDHIEIISTFNKYEEIRVCTEGEKSTTLIIVQRRNNIDT